MRPLIPIALMFGLAGCAGGNLAASVRGACDAFERPAEPIKGANRYSQRWADKTVEAGVSACGWSRPRATAG